jgi:hypothetical protein
MKKAGHIAVHGMIAAALRGPVIALLALVLAACSAGSLLTDSSSPSSGEPRGKTVPPIAFQQITGIPPGKLSELKGALTAAGGQHDIGFVAGTFQSGVFSLAGNFKATSESAGVRLVYQWQFRDADGVLIDTIDGEDNAGVYSGSDPWAAVSTAVLDRIARRTAEAMARKLSAMGYAARLASLTAPPAELFAMAAPDAHREIDFETVNGPGLGAAGAAFLAGADQVVTHEEITPAVASVAPIPGEGQMPRIALAEEPSAAPPPAGDGLGAEVPDPAPAPAKPAKKAKPGQREIRAVAVVPVKGSPAGGDAELTAAMRKTLSAAGWPVVGKPQPDALTIAGRVKLADKGKDAQSVTVIWQVSSPDGKPLGDVNQANDVPKGALDQGWGPAATAVAEAAATGIFDIVKRYR